MKVNCSYLISEFLDPAYISYTNVFIGGYKLNFFMPCESLLCLVNRMGRDMAYDSWSCDLLCAASSPDLYRINLAQVCPDYPQMICG